MEHEKDTDPLVTSAEDVEFVITRAERAIEMATDVLDLARRLDASLTYLYADAGALSDKVTALKDSRGWK